MLKEQGCGLPGIDIVVKTLVGKASKKLVGKMVPLTVNPAIKVCKEFVRTITAMLQEAPATREAKPVAITPSDPAVDAAAQASGTAVNTTTNIPATSVLASSSPAPMKIIEAASAAGPAAASAAAAVATAKAAKVAIRPGAKPEVMRGYCELPCPL